MTAIAAVNLCTEQIRTHSPRGTIGGAATMATPMARVSLMRVTMAAANLARVSARRASTLIPAPQQWPADPEMPILMASILETAARTAGTVQGTESLASSLSRT